MLFKWLKNLHSNSELSSFDFPMNTSIKSPAYNERIRFLILHYTVGDFTESVYDLTTKVSSHYLVPDFAATDYAQLYGKKKQVFRLLPESKRAWHAGISYWRRVSGLNDTSIGIEIVNQACEDKDNFYFPAFPEDQINAVISLCQFILRNNPGIRPTGVLGHMDIAPTRKTDPGPKFPWKKFYEAGIGAWYEEDVKQAYEKEFSSIHLPKIEVIQEKLAYYGYQIEQTGKLDQITMDALRALQLHFRPTNFDGKPDAETMAILYALIDRYYPSN